MSKGYLAILVDKIEQVDIEINIRNVGFPGDGGGPRQGLERGESSPRQGYGRG